MKWKIGNIEIKNQVGLAPMAGISNPAYMKIVEEMGVGYAVTELISSEAIVRNNKKTFDMLRGIETLNMPVAVQIFGSDPETMAKSAKIITDLYQNVFIDINMGCPVPKVAMRAEAGSALLKSPDKIFDIVSSVVGAVDVPITVKIRSGWDHNSINAIEVAKIIEKAGACAITIHARTRSQGYSGNADWNIIKQVKESVNISVIGNGDIKTIYDAKRMIDETKCDAIMVGRASLGNPFLLGAIVKYLENGIIDDNPSYIQKIDMAIYHLKLLLKYNDEKKAVLEMRSNLAFYLKGLKGSSDIKNRIFKITNFNEIINILKQYKDNYEIDNN